MITVRMMLFVIRVSELLGSDLGQGTFRVIVMVMVMVRLGLVLGLLFDPNLYY